MANTITITVNIQTQGATAAINGINATIKTIGTTTNAASQQATSGFNAISQAINQSTSAVSQLTSALAGLAAIRVGAAMVEAADAINRAQIALKTMTGSANVAQETLDQIRHIAKEQPFSFTELIETTQRLKAFGFEASKLPAMVETISNAAAALGKGKAGVDSITLALGQMRQKGIVQGQELFRQLAEQGIQAGEYLRKAVEQELGKPVNMTEFRRMIEKGIIQSEPAIAVIMAGIRKEFGSTGQEMSKLVSVRFEKLADDLRDLARIVLDDLAPAIIKVTNYLQDFVQWMERLPKWARDAAEALAIFTTAVIGLNAAFKALALIGLIGNLKALAGVIETIAVAAKLAIEAGSIGAFFSLLGQSAMLANPALALLAANLGAIAAALVTIAGSIWVGNKLRDMIPTGSALAIGLGIDDEREALKQEAILRQKNLELAQKMRTELAKTDKTYQKAPAIAYDTMSDRDLNLEITRLAQAMETVRQSDADKRKKLIAENKELIKHQNEIAQEALERALGKQEGAIFGLGEKYAGLLRQVAGNAEATKTVLKAEAIELQTQKEKFAEKNKDALEKQIDLSHKEYEKELAFWSKRYEEHLKFQEKTLEIAQKAATSAFEFEPTVIESRRDKQIAELGVNKRQTLQEEITYQQQVAAIKIQSLQDVQEVRIDLERKAFDHELAQIQALEEIHEITSEERKEREIALVEETNERIRQIVVRNGFETEAIRLAANKATNEAIYEEQKKIYDKLKSSLDRVFDALLHKSTSIWEAIGNGLKTAIIGAIKEIVTSRAAAALMQMFGYGSVSFGGGPRGLGGQQPTFGGGVGGGGSFLGRMLGLGGAVGSFGSGAPGGTGGFAGPVTSLPDFGNQSGQARSAPGFGQASGLSGGLKGLLGMGNVAAFGGGAGGTAAALASSPAAGIAGALLAAGGLKRGGVAGLGMTVAGGFLTGAAIGMLIGGPFGAAIGAFVGTVVGLVAGTIRLFAKTADEKLRTKIKTVYGIDVADKKVRAQILTLAQQRYGGNLDMAVRSPEVQQLVQLYAMATGQTAGGMPRPMYGASFAQSGSGGLQLQPVYSNGQAIANPYTGTTTSQWATAGLYLQLNPQQANDLFAGKVVNVINNNPASVAQASATGARNGNSRDAARGALLEPLTVVR